MAIIVERVSSPCGIRAKSPAHRYFTDPGLLDLVDETVGAGYWGDPCGDPFAPAWSRAAWAFDIRCGENGLLLPWPATPAFINPPFDDCVSWLERAAGHGREVLALVPAQPGSAYWRRIVWACASAVVFVGRPKFGHVLEADDPGRGRRTGDIISTQHPTDCAVVAFGIDRSKMLRVWSGSSVVVAPVQGEVATLHTHVEVDMS
ncbi:hypothetical protein OV203_37085 [Nannocystis sp. ILAH1]|uniref:hypothetical protein n=1 Tax=Nannocystis sp. ILAH1 TaxID=2996789 RepID=UPI00226FA786|nr:hypothetical protein [Nannocystis sp. ILAH1]MCY0992815.1 hypothetical protein [Nannocystis sp. ILAH1]